MSSAGTPPCALCLTYNLLCETKAGFYKCRTCVDHGVDCSLFYVTVHECIPCVVSHKKCHTRHGQTDCAWCEGKDLICIPAPKDKELKKQLRLPKYKTNSGNAQSPSMATKKRKEVDEESKEFAISRSGPSTPPLRTRRRAAIEEEEEEEEEIVDSEPEHVYPVFSPRANLPSHPHPRTYATPDDYVPPSLPMLDPNTSPKSPPKKVANWEPIDTSFSPSSAELAYNPTAPLAEDPTLSTFMCCNKVICLPYHNKTTTEGHLLLKKFFRSFSAYYPIDSAVVDSTEGWAQNSLYMGISDGDVTKPAEIYAVIDLDKGHLCHMTDAPGSSRPEIGGMQLAVDMSKNRFWRIPGGLDLECEVHEHDFIAYFMYFLAEGQEYVAEDYE